MHRPAPGNLAFLLRDGTFELVDLVLNTFHTCVQAFNLSLQVLHLEGQFTAECFLLVDGREGRLQLEEGLQLLLH